MAGNVLGRLEVAAVFEKRRCLGGPETVACEQFRELETFEGALDRKA